MTWEIKNTRGCSNFSMQFVKKMQTRHAFYLLTLFPCTVKTPISTQTSCHLLLSMPQIVLDVRVEWLYWNSIEWYSNSCLFVNSLNQHQFWNWTSEEKICPRFKVPRVKNLTR
jgi:hypothetical protein